MNINAVIKQLRINQGMTQGLLAEKVGISRQCLGQIERNRDNASLKTLTKILQVLNHRIIVVPNLKNKEG